MLWSKEKTSDTDSFVDIFAKTSLDPPSTDPKQAKNDEAEDREFAKRAKRYDKKFKELALERREEGKKLFGQKYYIKAMQEFNRSLMFAQPGSEEVGLAYANRSACFFFLNMLKECLADIELAKKSNYPKHLMNKLHDRVTKCLNLEEKSPKSESSPIRGPTLSFEEHERFGGVAECLEIQKNDEFGQHVITTCDLEIGQTIIIERPFSIVPTKFCIQNRDRCFYCFAKLRNFITCDDCLVGFYCDKYCMKKAFHKTDCNMEIFSDDKELIELVVKTFLSINAAFSDVDVLMKTVDSLLKGIDVTEDLTVKQRSFCSIFQLDLNREKYSVEQSNNLKSNSNTAYDIITSFPDIKEKYVTKEQQFFLQHLILHLFYAVEHAIDSQEFIRRDEKSPLASYAFEHYAKAIYSFGCYIKHSCIPNVYCFSVDDRLICKVIRPIKEGEQIFRSYL